MSKASKPADELQGEGNYDAAERYDEDVRDFVNSGKVKKAARDAAPKDVEEQRELEEAEAEGRARAHGGHGKESQ